MKIVVPFKSVIDPQAMSATGVPAPDAKSIINPFDAIALEQALQLRQNGKASEVVCVTIGTSQVEEQVRAALAMGADRATRIDDDRELDPYAVSRILQAFVQREMPNLVIMGKQAVDDDCNQVGQMLAGLLGWPQATFISELELIEDQTRAKCTRETDAGLETIAVRLPAIITADLRLNEPRYVSLPGLLKARRKPIELLTLDQLNVSVDPLTEVLKTTPPAKRPPGVRVESVGELLAKLRDEANVI